jgi:hypothetical protein
LTDVVKDIKSKPDHDARLPDVHSLLVWESFLNEIGVEGEGWFKENAAGSKLNISG